jgi:hypothetical protein
VPESKPLYDEIRPFAEQGAAIDHPLSSIPPPASWRGKAESGWPL